MVNDSALIHMVQLMAISHAKELMSLQNVTVDRDKMVEHGRKNALRRQLIKA